MKSYMDKNFSQGQAFCPLSFDHVKNSIGATYILQGLPVHQHYVTSRTNQKGR